VKLADIEGNDREAQPGLTGKCRDCGHAMVAKCGQHRVWHWAHRKSKDCDPWWEQETEWHRSWKNQFPASRGKRLDILRKAAKGIEPTLKRRPGWS